MILINGVKIKTPKSFAPSIYDIDGQSERNAQGDLLRDRITTKRKLELEWPAMTFGEVSTLLNAVKDEKFSCTYPDPYEGTMVTKYFYRGDVNVPMYSFERGLWESIKMNFIEY